MQQGLRRDESRLLVRFAWLVVAVVGLAACLYVLVSYVSYSDVMRDTALVEARALNSQMAASWDYIDSVQDAINHDRDGRYDFKGVACSVAAKETARIFTENTEGYAIRYVRMHPRNPEDFPDEFEMEALAAFKETDAQEYYLMTQLDGMPVLRYASRLNMDESCLTCHGDPQGSRDDTGGYREGMKLDSVAGAASIVVPVDQHVQSARLRSIVTILFFLALILAVALVIQAGLRAWVLKPLRKSNRRLEEENDAKTHFLDLASHELKTPLASIIAYADLMEQNLSASPQEQLRLIDEIRQNGNSLLRMANNMVDTARVEAGSYGLELEEIDVSDVVNDVIATMEPLAEKGGVALSFEMDPQTPIVLADWDAMRQIVLNLVSNAVKFTPRGGSVLVRAAAAKTTGGSRRMTLDVIDTGCGIADEDRERVFERFERVEGGVHKEGSGLGLPLARRLARMQGGDLVMESTPGEGSRFTLTIPAVDEGRDDQDVR